MASAEYRSAIADENEFKTAYGEENGSAVRLYE